MAEGVGDGVGRGNIIYNYGVREWLLMTGGGATKQNRGVGASDNVLAILKGRHERFCGNFNTGA